MALNKLDIAAKSKGQYVQTTEFNEIVDGVNSIIDTLNGASSVQYNCILQNNMGSKNITASKEDPCRINLTYISQERYSYSDPYEDTGERGLCEISIKNSKYDSYTVVKQFYLNSGTSTDIDITDYFTSGSNSVMFKVTGEVTGQTTPALVYTVYLTTLSVNGDNFAWWTPYVSDFTFNLNIGGNVSKILYITVTGTDYTASYQATLGTTLYTETYYNYVIPHPGKTGVYNLSAYVANSDGTLKTKTLSYNIMCVLTGAADKLMVINDLVSKFTNWAETTLFNYALYDGGATTSGAVFTLLKGADSEYSSTEDEIPTASKNSFLFSSEIETTDDSNFTADLTIKNLDATALHDPLSFTVDNSLGYSSVSGAVLNINPRTRSNSQSNKKAIINEMDQSIVAATWTNMNWQSDGWVTNDNNNKVLRLLSSSILTIAYAPFATECARVGKTIEFDYLASNVSDYTSEIISLFSAVNDSYVGLRIFPNKIVMFTQSLKNEEFQSIPTDDEVRTRVSLVVMPDAYGNSGFNLCIIYINGKKCRTFVYENNDYFAQAGQIILGSDSSDLDIYGIRVYDSALTSTSVLKNYINWLETTDLKGTVKLANDVLNTDGSDLDYTNIADQYSVFVFDNTFPSFNDQANRTGTLWVYFFLHPEKNFSITFVTMSGQGTSSKKYLEWNEKIKIDKTKSVITYADGTTGSVKVSMFAGVPSCAAITFKKNWASSMQDHKAGSVNSYTALYKTMGLTNEAIDADSTVRVSVYQEPFIGFQKSTNEDGDVVYTCMGEFTGGPDKGDSYCFGYNTTTFPGLISIEGSDNSPLPALFRVPWTTDRITLSSDGSEFVYNNTNCWDFDGGLAANITKWIPAYNLVYQCSNRIKPFDGTLDELNAAVATYKSTGYDYWIAKSGDSNRYNLYYYEAGESAFIGADIGDGTINLSTQLVDKGYGITAAILAAATDNDAINTLFINARIAKFRAEAGSYFDIEDALFHSSYIEFFAGTDNRAKNTYPYTFGTTTSKWKWRVDDLDTIMVIDNEGKVEKDYFVEVHDTYANGSNVWNGETSNFWNLIELAFPSELITSSQNMMAAMATLGGFATGTAYDKIYAFYAKYYLGIKEYFPINIVNADAKRYEKAKLQYIAGTYVNDTDPITQSLGDTFSTEKAWMKKRIVYMMSKYSYGIFGTSGVDSINVRASGSAIQYKLTPAIQMYPTVVNGTSIVRGARTAAGSQQVVTVELSGTGDQQNIIQGASYLEDIGEWYDKQVSGSMIVSGKRLKKLNIGHATQAVTISISALTLSNCIALQELLLTRVSTLTGTLILTACTHLKKVYASGTSIVQIKLPTGGTLEYIIYPATNQYISLQNFPLLTTANVVITDCTAIITDLFIADCPLVDVISILQTIMSAQSAQTGHSLKRIRLVGFSNSYSGTTGSAMLDLLATLANGTYAGLDSDGIAGSDEYPVLDGTMTVDANCYEDSIATLKSKFTKLVLNITGQFYIRFADSNILAILLAHWGDGSGMTKTVAATVTGFQLYFQGNTTITKFNELQYFVGITTSFYATNYNDSYAFMNCTALQEVTIPPNLLQISGSQGNRGDFYGCTSLKTVTFASNSKCLYIKETAFYNCLLLSSINLPASIIEIWFKAFCNCVLLTSFNLPSSLTTIYTSAFEGCTGLVKVTCDSSVLTVIKDYAFYRCTSLTNISLPSSVIEIDQAAFRECNSLKSIDLSHVTSMPANGAQFWNCSSLTSVIIGEGLTYLNAAFYGCSSLISVTLPSTLITLLGNVFANCSSLNSITLPASLKTIGDGCFDGCTSLETIIIPNSVTSIGNNVFQNGGTDNVLKVIFKNGGTEGLTIGTNIFFHNGQVTCLVLPSRTISMNGFGYGEGVTDLYVKATTPPTLASNLGSRNIWVPSGCAAAYKAATNWSTYASKINEYTTIPSDYDTVS